MELLKEPITEPKLEPQQAILENPGRIVVIGDIHGDIDRLMNIIISLKLFSQTLEWIAEPQNTIVIQLGDQIDSMDRSGMNALWDYNSIVCKEGILDLNVITMMERLSLIAETNGGKVISLIGNHELLNLIHNFEYVSPCSMNIVNPELRKELFARGNGQFTQILARRNIIVKIGRFLFCHGGILPDHLELLHQTYGNIDLNQINIIFRKFILNQELTPEQIKILENVIINDNGILWTRFYMNLLMNMQGNPSVDLIFDNVLRQVLFHTGCKGMFIGHNIVERITSVSNNKLFFVDAALSRAFNTNRIQVVEIVTQPSGEEVVNLIELPCIDC